MDVGFDRAKDAINRRKHGVSLQAAERFDLDTALFVLDDSQDYGEQRYNAIGWIEGTLHVLTFTIRQQQVRAISLRRATRQEQKQYAENF
ncbi:MAG TPA: BrnT family toxin [Acidobacteriaceae bacterium]|nr:BrnT family toxin [Acidobacteriaceae bacterium]